MVADVVGVAVASYLAVQEGRRPKSPRRRAVRPIPLKAADWAVAQVVASSELCSLKLGRHWVGSMSSHRPIPICEGLSEDPLVGLENPTMYKPIAHDYGVAQR